MVLQVKPVLCYLIRDLFSVSHLVLLHLLRLAVYLTLLLPVYLAVRLLRPCLRLFCVASTSSLSKPLTLLFYLKLSTNL